MFFNKYSIASKPTGVETALSGFAKSLTMPTNLRDAAAFALATAQAMTREEAMFKQLGIDTASIVYSVCILQEQTRKDKDAPDIAQNILSLKMTVENIKIFAEAQLKRNPVVRGLRCILKQQDLGKVEEHRRKLNQAGAPFGLHTNNAQSQERPLRALERSYPVEATQARRLPPGEEAIEPHIYAGGPATVTRDQIISTSNNTEYNTNSGNTVITAVSDSFNRVYNRG